MAMKPVPLLLAAGAIAAIPACSIPMKQGAERVPAARQQVPDWRVLATPNDRSRLRKWRSAWTSGLEKARAAGHAAAIAKEGALLQPDAALAWAPPPPGTYSCRVIKVGAKSEGLLDYVSYPAFSCRIRQETELLGFAKLTGSQRPIGVILPQDNRRAVFLGTLQLGDEKRALEYGRDQERDLAAYVERIGERRWRMVFPYPHFESTIDVLELIPTG